MNPKLTAAELSEQTERGAGRGSKPPTTHELSLRAAADSKIFYCLPHNGEWIPEGIPSASIPSHRYPVQWRLNRSSFLNHSFNMYWCAALNEPTRPTYWAMHHADMSTTPGWLDVLIDIMDERDADVVSCVAAIKDASGDTNAAKLTELTKERCSLQRLKLAECAELPEVFSAEDLGCPLLVNTGLWVVRFDRPWVEKFPGFSFNNSIRNVNGRWQAECMSEDWKFSIWAAQEGLKVYATTKLKTFHYGPRAWPVGGEGWASEFKREVEIREKIAEMNGAEANA